MKEAKPQSTWCLVHRDGSVLASRKSLQAALRTAEIIGARVFRYVPGEQAEKRRRKDGAT